MKTITARNVNEALKIGTVMMKGAEEQGYAIDISPRGEPTIEYPEPVTTVYNRPRERVLFSPIRDANPFFHLMESLWILAGREDVGFLDYYNSKIADYSDDKRTFHGAYGFRMRRLHGDQIATVIKMLKEDPDTRRAVISIWNAGLDLNRNSKDIPCNDLIFFKIRKGELNITVANRSNDMLWGAYGANAVQFSMLQEYVAAHVGVEVGVYRQVSDSFHIYTGNPQWEDLKADPYGSADPYRDGFVHPVHLMNDPARWDNELSKFFSVPSLSRFRYEEPFFRDIVIPMVEIWEDHKRTGEGLEALEFKMPEGDWKLACKGWLQRRES